MKKIVSVLLSALMVGAAATSLPFSASAATAAEHGVSDSVGSVQDYLAIDFINDSEVKIVKAIPHNLGVRIAQQDFSSDCSNKSR